MKVLKTESKPQVLSSIASINLKEYNYHKPLVMGIVNITPNSFSDGGKYVTIDAACQQALEMVELGADIIDIGGEASNPKSMPISTAEELSRVIPAIEKIASQSDVCISIDTYKPEVMEAAIKSGASMVNDITALSSVKACAIVKEYDVPVCLMHMQGTPQTMQNNPTYKNITADINDFFKQKINKCVDFGIKRERLILDPGFGFGKTVEHNLQLLGEIEKFKLHGLPVLLGVSRKSTVGYVLNESVDNRLFGSLAASIYGILNGVNIIRTHDVPSMHQAFTMINAITDNLR